MSITVPQKYDSKVEEARIQTFWQTKGIYKFNPRSTKKIFSIDTPPPTISGRMHIGHAFSYTQQDIVARFQRMQNKEVFYPFGTDDNGLPTEKLVQKEKNVNANKMEREAFINLCKQYVAAERPAFIADWIAIGMSCDFSNPYSSIDDNSRKIAQESFLALVKQGRVYRKEAPVIWDTMFQTAIAQAELVDVEQKTFFNDIIFKAENGENLIIATTRPELLGGCVAVFYNPLDPRYSHLKDQFATTPIYGVKVPLLADERVSLEKGTGLVMCCTFGDQTDIEWYKQYNLPLRMVINKDGTMNEQAGKYKGLKIKEARIQIIADLKEAELLVNQKEITNTVNVGERSGIPIEIINSKQWYVSYLDKAEEFFERAQQLTWKPEFMKHRLENWIRGLNWDWSISRQRKYGVPIPVWYDTKGNTYYADESQLPVDPLIHRPLSAPKDVELIPESDVFDTWFTSSSSPFLATYQYKGTAIYDQLHPMSLRPQAHDIINFWLFYTMAKTDLIHNRLPWTTCAISGYVLDPKGEKMSKSKGNTISPQEVVKKYSADAIRFWAAGSKLGEDLAYQEKDLVTANKLVNKLWNAAKFMEMFCANFDDKKPATLHENDQWVITELAITTQEAIAAFENYEYAKAKSIIEDFFWTHFCDSYIESIKKIMYQPTAYKDGMFASAQYTLKYVLTQLTKLFAPFIPHITESVYQYYIAKDLEATVHTLAWEVPEHNMKILEVGRTVHDILSATRRYKAGKNLPLNTPIEPSMIIGCSKIQQETFAPFKEIIAGTVAAANVSFMDVESMTEESSFVVKDMKIMAPVAIK